MSTDFDKLREVFQSALEQHPPSQWDAYLDQACAGDGDLRHQAGQLLKAHAEGGSLTGQTAPGEDRTALYQPAAPGPGTAVGPYRLREQIGEGGMGLVFVAEQQHPVRRKVALKVIKPGMDTRQVVARFEAERQALALMDHPHIAKVFDGGTTPDGRPYFVMELVKGTPITEYCDAHRLSPRQRLELFLDVCNAVQHAHQKGIIHRDIKPSNVLVTVHDVAPVVKVIDFGIAKATGGQLTDRTVYTAYAQMIGTPLYMSPEQAGLSGLDVDTRSDVYSLGVLLYELLTGTTPFDKERLRQAGYDEMRRIIREEEPPRPSTRLSTMRPAALSTVAERRAADQRKLSRRVRGELDWVVMKALEKDRNRRYESPSAFAADVRRFLDDEPVQACPPSRIYRLRKLVRRHKAGLGVAACLLAVLAVLSGGVGWVASDRATRAQKATEAIETALQESAEWQRRRRVSEALAAARRAQAALSGGHAEAALRRRVEARVDDLELLARLEEARLESTGVKDGHFDEELADRRYVEIFREFRLDLEAWPTEEAGQHIRESTVAPELAALLDEWAVRRRALRPEEEARWKHLLDVARAADPDGWRTRLRDALERQDSQALVSLMSSDEAALLLPWTLGAVGKTLVKAGALQPAEAVLRNAQQRYPDDFWINLFLWDAINKSEHPGGRKAQAEEVIPFLRVCVALRPQSPGAHINLGIALDKKGDAVAAAAEYREALRLKNDYAQAHCNLGDTLHNKGDLDGAIAEYRDAIRHKEDFARAHNGLGAALYWKGDVDGAIAEYRQAIRLKPGYAEAHNNLGHALTAKGDVDGAAAEFREAVRPRPDNAEAHRQAGDAFCKLGKWEEAIAEYRAGLRVMPDSGGLHFLLGRALAKQGKLEEANTELREAARLNPNSLIIQNDVAWFLATAADPKWRDPTQAYEHAKRAVVMGPKQPYCWGTLGVAAYRNGNWNEAVAALKKSQELLPHGHPADWLFLAMAHWQLGQQDEAREWYGKAAAWIRFNNADDELSRFRAEAEQLPGIAAKPGAAKGGAKGLRPSRFPVVRFDAPDQAPPKSGTPAVVILDSTDPTYEKGKPHNNGLRAFTSAGVEVWSQTGLSTCGQVGGKCVAIDRKRGRVYVAETVADRITAFDLQGNKLWQIQQVEANCLMVDDRTGNLWCSGGPRIDSGETIVFDDGGNEVTAYPYVAIDMAYDPHTDAFWLVGTQILKLTRDGEIAFKESIDGWCCVSASVNPKDGSIWIAERRHPDEVQSKNCLWLRNADGSVRHKIDLGDTRISVVGCVPATGEALFGAYLAGLHRAAPDGKVTPLGTISATSICVSPSDGQIWVTTDDAVIRIDGEGNVQAKAPFAVRSPQSWIAAN
jgi:serine/threonine protein kinase/tetratricopeptide (TPR) repeat protein